ncbi:MAG: radical SAM protein, partial [Planctomycetota bacterium]
GTPYLLGKHLQEIQDQIRRSFAVEGPCGIELHPADIDSGTSSKLRDAGFTMVSIGAQSFQANCLRTLGREPEDVSGRIALMKDAAISVIDVDLIFGLPGQTAQDIQQDFRIAVASGATQISTYPFIDFSYADNPQRPLGRRRKKELLEAVLEVRADLGFERTAVWTFARRDSGRYSSVTRDNYLGFGPSAASLLPSGFSMNVFSVGEYIHAVEEGRSPTALEVDFTGRERALFWLFWSIYNLHVSRDDYSTMFGKPLEEMFGWELRLAAGMGLVKRRNDVYEVTKRGAYLFHLVEQRYTDQYIDKIWGFARSTPWPEKLVIR